MKLRLRIIREDGTVSRFLWDPEEETGKPRFTIAQLLEQVDRKVGLLSLSNPKSLYDFVVEVYGSGFPDHAYAARLLKEGDEVT